jgi:hypothetical protein
MAGQMGRARSNDIVPNGGIIPLPNITLPGTLSLETYRTYGKASVLNCLGAGTWSASTLALPTAGVAHAAGNEVYLPVNGATKIYFQGSGALAMTLYPCIGNADL